MGEYRVTVFRTTRYAVLADSAEEAERRVREDADGLEVVDRETEVLVEPLTLIPTEVPDQMGVNSHSVALLGPPLDAAGPGTSEP
jgi:hypothetical protein